MILLSDITEPIDGIEPISDAVLNGIVAGVSVAVLVAIGLCALLAIVTAYRGRLDLATKFGLLAVALVSPIVGFIIMVVACIYGLRTGNTFYAKWSAFAVVLVIVLNIVLVAVCGVTLYINNP